MASSFWVPLKAEAAARRTQVLIFQQVYQPRYGVFILGTSQGRSSSTAYVKGVIFQQVYQPRYSVLVLGTFKADAAARRTSKRHLSAGLPVQI